MNPLIPVLFLVYVTTPYLLTKIGGYPSNLVYGCHEIISELLVIYALVSINYLNRRLSLMLAGGFACAAFADFGYMLSIINPARESSLIFAAGEIFYVTFYGTLAYFLYCYMKRVENSRWLNAIGLLAAIGFCFISFYYVLVPFYLRDNTPSYYYITFCTTFSLLEIVFVFYALPQTLQAKSLNDFVFYFALILMCCGDFAIRFEEAFNADGILSGLEYSWCFAMSLHAFNFLSGFGKEKQQRTSPLFSLRVMSVFCCFILLFTFCAFLVKMGLLNIENALSISGLLISFCAAWFLSNLISIQLSRYTESLVIAGSTTNPHQFTKIKSTFLSEIHTVIDQYNYACDKISHLAGSYDDLKKNHNLLLEETYKGERYVSHELKSPFSILITIIQELYSNPSRENIESLNKLYVPVLREQIVKINRMCEVFGIRKGIGSRICKTSIGETVAVAIKEFNTCYGYQAQGNIDKELVAYTEKSLLVVALSNIMANALEQTQHNTEIRIYAESDPAWIYLRIHNTGSYISPSELEKIFDEGYSNKEMPSAGIGLASVKLLLENLGHKISCHSAQEPSHQWTEFVVHIKKTSQPL